MKYMNICSSKDNMGFIPSKCTIENQVKVGVQVTINRIAFTYPFIMSCHKECKHSCLDLISLTAFHLASCASKILN